MSTHAERLAWQYDEQTAGIYAEPSLAEQFEEQDTTFRHFDSYVFAPSTTAVVPGRDTGADAGPSPPPGAAPPVSYRPDARKPRSPLHAVPADSEAGRTADPLGAPGLAPSIERWMWAA